MKILNKVVKDKAKEKFGLKDKKKKKGKARPSVKKEKEE